MYAPRMHLKKRSLKLLLNKIQEFQTSHQYHYETKWKPWYKKATEIGQFWGYERAKLGYNLIQTEKQLLFTFNSDGYTHSCPQDKDSVRCIPENDLPLAIADPHWEKYMDVLEGRLKGTIQAIPYRQDLIDEYFHVNWKQTRLYRVLGAYKDILYRKLQDKFDVKIYNRFNPTKLIVLHHSDQDFYLIRSHHSLELLDKNDYIVHTVTKV